MDSQPDWESAVELLVMACMYDVPHLVCIAEMALLGMLDTDNCCGMLAVADHHEAKQLRARCLHYIRKLRHLPKVADSVEQQLSEELQSEVAAD